MAKVQGVYRRGGKWCTRLRMKDGSRPEFSFDTQAEAIVKLEELKAQRKTNEFVHPKKVMTLGAVCDQWFQGLIDASRNGGGHRPTSLLQWQSHIGHIKSTLEPVKCDELNCQIFEKARTHWINVRGLSPKTAGKVMTTAARILRYGKKNGTGVTEIWTSLLERTKLTNGELTPDGKLINETLDHVRPATEQEVLEPLEIKALLLAMEPGQYKVVTQVGLYSGLRISEILALKWSDIDFKEGVIHVQRTLSTAKVKGMEDLPKYRWFAPKTKRGLRDVPLTPSLSKALEDWGLHGAVKNDLDLVFCSAGGVPLDRTAYGRIALEPALKRAEIEKPITAHRLRHGFASILIESGRPDVESAYYLGHSVDVFRTIYAHFIKRKGKKNTMDDVDRLIENG